MPDIHGMIRGPRTPLALSMMPYQQSILSPPTPGLPTYLGFLAMCVGMFLAILDIQIVASSLIDIQADLQIPQNRLSYLQTTYLIAEIVAIGR